MFLSLARLRAILALALPIIGGMLSQNVLNLVDTCMVGDLGDHALAAVGLASFAHFMCVAPLTALSAGVQAMAARRMGEGRTQEAAIPLNGGLVLALSLGLPASWLLHHFAASLFALLASDAAVREAGTPYLQVRVLAMSCLGMNFAFRGYWNATGRAWFYMGTLVVMHACNIGLNWLFIYGNAGMPRMGVTGAGLASAVSTVLGTLIYFSLASGKARQHGFLHGLPTRKTLAAMWRLSAPTGLQQFFFAAGMTTFLRLIGTLGTEAIAASKVVLDLILVALLPSIGFGLAATTFVGESLGRKQPQEARRWGWDVAQTAFLTVAVVGLPAALFPEQVLSLFIESPTTRALGAGPLRLVALTIGPDAVGMVLMNCLLGAGDNRRVMLVSIGLQWLIFLPALFALVQWTQIGLLTAWLLQVSYRTAGTVVYAALWRGTRWTQLQV